MENESSNVITEQTTSL